jgi:hypothetical protein
LLRSISLRKNAISCILHVPDDKQYLLGTLNAPIDKVKSESENRLMPDGILPAWDLKGRVS